jgi:hypothetical protein
MHMASLYANTTCVMHGPCTQVLDDNVIQGAAQPNASAAVTSGKVMRGPRKVMRGPASWRLIRRDN